MCVLCTHDEMFILFMNVEFSLSISGNISDLMRFINKVEKTFLSK